jgi:hypothetical protein
MRYASKAGELKQITERVDQLVTQGLLAVDGAKTPAIQQEADALDAKLSGLLADDPGLVDAELDDLRVDGVDPLDEGWSRAQMALRQARARVRVLQERGAELEPLLRSTIVPDDRARTRLREIEQELEDHAVPAVRKLEAQIRAMKAARAA